MKSLLLHACESFCVLAKVVLSKEIVSPFKASRPQEPNVLLTTPVRTLSDRVYSEEAIVLSP